MLPEFLPARLNAVCLLVVGMSALASAQQNTVPRYDTGAFERGGDYYDQVAAAIPPDVIAKVKAAKTEQERDIVGKVFFKDQILKAETVHFSDFSTLILTNPTLPWIAIATKDLVIESEDGDARITRPSSPDAEAEFAKQLRGADGVPGVRGKDGPGIDPNRNGYPGGNGTDGNAATGGGRQQLPLLYIFAQNVRWGTTPDQPPRPGLLVFYDGITGGNGGRGGNGGIGGNGYVGADGDSTAFNCRHGPGRGGSGGFGGRGGRGGDAGDGGDGGSVVLAGMSKVLPDFILVRQEGAKPGSVGFGGMSARGGAGARGGRPRAFCHGNGPNGIDRTGTILTNNGNGDLAAEGLRGSKVYLGFNVDLVF
jgi:hypothetical protein